MAVKKINKTNSKQCNKETGQRAKNTAKKATMPEKTAQKKNKFEGARAIAFTDKSIIVEKAGRADTAKTKKTAESRTYYENTPKNRQEAAEAINKKGIKKVILN